MNKCDNSDCKCETKCDDCACDDSPVLDNFFDGKKMAEMMQDANVDGGHLSYCYSSARAPRLWMGKLLKDLKKAGKSLKDSKFEDLPRDMNRFMQVYVNNTVMMSQDVSSGMFSIIEFVELQSQMLEALRCFAKNHIMEVIKFDDNIEWEHKLLLIDCVAGDDFQKSSFIMGRKKQHEE